MLVVSQAERSLMMASNASCPKIHPWCNLLQGRGLRYPCCASKNCILRSLAYGQGYQQGFQLDQLAGDREEATTTGSRNDAKPQSVNGKELTQEVHVEGHSEGGACLTKAKTNEVAAQVVDVASQVDSSLGPCLARLRFHYLRQRSLIGINGGGCVCIRPRVMQIHTHRHIK